MAITQNADAEAGFAAPETEHLPVRTACAPTIPRRIAACIGCLVTAAALLVLLGWLLGIEAAQSILPSWPGMAPATATGFALAGAALTWLATASAPYPSRPVPRTRLARSFAAMAALIGLLKLGDYALGLHLDFDMLGFQGIAFVAPATAADFLLIGCALVLAGTRRFRTFQALTLAAALIGWLGFAGYFYGGGTLPPFAQMAAHTALLFILLSIGVLCLRTDDGLMSLLTSGTASGKLTLSLLLLAPPLPLILDALQNALDGTGSLPGVNLMPLFTSLDAILLAGLVWTAGMRLGRSDEARNRAEANNAKHQAQLSLFVEHAPAAIAMLDRDMRYIAVSRRWLSDYRLADQDIRGRSHYDVFPEIPEHWREIHSQCLDGAVHHSDEDLFPRSDGTTDWLHWEMHPWRDSEGEIGGLFLFSEVITERKHAAERIERLNHLYATLCAINSLIVRVRDSQTLFSEACRIALDVGGFQAAWIGLFDAGTNEVQPVASAGLADDDPLLAPLDVADGGTHDLSLPARAIRERRPVFENDIAVSEARGDPRCEEILDRGYRAAISLPLIVDGFVSGNIAMWSAEPNRFDEDELKLLVELSNDVSFALQYLTKQEELDYISYYDILTGLPNRMLFEDRLSQQLRMRAPQTQHVALLIFDIERFRMINDTLGRHGGDDLLRAVAHRLTDTCGGKDNIARVGADCFAVAIRGAERAADIAHEIESRILPCFKYPFDIAGTDLRMSAKIGLAMYPDDGRDADMLFRNAEAALKQAKTSGNGYMFYASEMNARATEALALETRLREAVEAGQFALHYQPKIRLDDNSICGLEALLRWQDPQNGLVLPDQFVRVLEETGLIVKVGAWAIERALADCREWAEAGQCVPRIAVNVSAVQIAQDDFVENVIALVENAGVAPEALELEITESVIMQDIQHCSRAFSILRDMGVQITLDDFGKGYSSLTHLSRLPIDKIKIERSFVAGMTENAQDRSVVATIIGLAHSFRLTVVAEGVETPEQAQSLRELGCDGAQGYLFSRPRPREDTVKLLKRAEAAA